MVLRRLPSVSGCCFLFTMDISSTYVVTLSEVGRSLPGDVLRPRMRASGNLAGKAHLCDQSGAISDRQHHSCVTCDSTRSRFGPIILCCET